MDARTAVTGNNPRVLLMDTSERARRTIGRFPVEWWSFWSTIHWCFAHAITEGKGGKRAATWPLRHNRPGFLSQRWRAEGCLTQICMWQANRVRVWRWCAFLALCEFSSLRFSSQFHTIGFMDALTVCERLKMDMVQGRVRPYNIDRLIYSTWDDDFIDLSSAEFIWLRQRAWGTWKAVECRLLQTIYWIKRFHLSALTP